MDYYDYDTFCCPTRDFKHSPLVDWPQHSFYQHSSFLSPILLSLHTYPTQSMQEQQQRRFPLRQQQQQQQPAYDYFESPQAVHVAPSLPSPLVSQVGCDPPNFESVVPQDSMEVPLSHPLEGWDDDRSSSLSSLVESEMNEMTAMISASNTSVTPSPIPIPVPNLTKKSRGRRVPTMSSLEDIRSAASGAGKKRQGIGGKTARMYLCEVKGCGKCFARGEHLKRHVRSIHTYEKREVWFLCFEAHIFICCAYSS